MRTSVRSVTGAPSCSSRCTKPVLGVGLAAAGLLRTVVAAHLAAAIAARGAMLGTGVLAAHGTRLHLILCEYRRRLLGAGGAVLPANQAPRCVGAVQVARAVHVPV